MVTLHAELLTHPAALADLTRELLDLRFDRARLTEALLAIQQAARDAQSHTTTDTIR